MKSMSRRRVPQVVKAWREAYRGRPLPASFWVVREGGTGQLLYITPYPAIALDGPAGATIVELRTVDWKVLTVARIGEGEGRSASGCSPFTNMGNNQ